MMARSVNGTERHWRKVEAWGRSQQNEEGRNGRRRSRKRMVRTDKRE
jgi:hypothetical protein